MTDDGKGKMDWVDEIAAAVRGDYPGTLIEVNREGRIPVLRLGSKWVVRVLFALRDRFDFESLSCETGSDHRDRIVLIYHLYSTRHRHMLVVKAELARENPQVETAEEVWAAANWYEREIFDLFGVEFIGHSDLQRIMLPPDWEGHPLLKDYQPAPEYHGMRIEW